MKNSEDLSGSHSSLKLNIMCSVKVGLRFLLDPLESLYGPLTPAYLIARELREKFDIVFVSQMIDKNVAELLKSWGFHTLNLHKHFFFSGSLRTLEAWLRKTNLELEDSESIVVNCSQCFLANAHVYYAQGPMTEALDDIRREMKYSYRLAYRIARKFLVKRDRAFVRKLKRQSKLFVANSNFCASMYENWGLKVDKVIYPPLDCAFFKPSTHNPSADYVLAYAGKETKYSVLKRISDAGVRMKIFGSKTPSLGSLPRQTNVEFLAKVSDEQLAILYSNALFTLSVFTHEPFGYIPVESMACGTPVLTYATQGPSESVLDGKTGWFVKDDQQLVDVAAQLWRRGYPSGVRGDCRKRALDFDAKAISGQWLELLGNFQSS